jgi:cellulose biosynthesis protein BcsQ
MSSVNLAKHHLPAEIVAALANWKNRAKIGVISNRKGGTGKTTISTFLGEGMALLAGKAVLIIDTDRQCNLSSTFGLAEKVTGEVTNDFSETGTRRDVLLQPPVHPDFEEGDNFAERSSSAEVMLEGGQPVLPYPTYIDDAVGYMKQLNPLGGRLDVLPADGERLKYIHSHASEYDAKTLYVRWATWLFNSNALNDYDLILFDTPPFDTALHDALYILADHTIVPVQACNDTLAASTAIAYAVMSAQSFDMRPRKVSTVVNPPANTLTKKEISWLERSIWANQFVGALPQGCEFPRARAIHERRDTAIAPHDEAYLNSLSEDDRAGAEKQIVRDIRELMLWQKPRDTHRLRLYNVIAQLCQKLLGEALPEDPYLKVKVRAKKPVAKQKTNIKATTRKASKIVSIDAVQKTSKAR